MIYKYHNTTNPLTIQNITYILVNKRNDTKYFLIYFYVKTKTIVYYDLRRCLRKTRLSLKNKQ